MIKYALSEIIQNASDPSWWRGRFIEHVIGTYFTKLRPPSGRSRIADRDWDNLILLDACRYDLFESVSGGAEIPGVLEKRRSIQSATPRYLEENFSDPHFHDVVYVTANPYVATELSDGTFHHVENVWQDGWDDEEQTVLPETMRDRALSVAEEYPDKRMIVHFDQPHAPFIGEERIGGRKVSAIRNEALGEDRPDPEERNPNPFDMIRTGEASADEVWNGYRSNLERAIEPARDLLTSLTGLNVITSDHGNSLGEIAWPFPIRIYGHPQDVLIPSLMEVPWLEYENGGRKQTTSDEPITNPEYDHERTDERLSALGYK